MKLWKNNRLDQQWELDPADIAERFLNSPWADYDNWNRGLAAFLNAPETEGGLQSSFDDADAFDAIVDTIRRRR